MVYTCKVKAVINGTMGKLPNSEKEVIIMEVWDYLNIIVESIQWNRD